MTISDEKICCEQKENYRQRGILSGIIYGLIPHSFCVAFAIFAVIGATTITAFLKGFLLIPNLFIYLVIISLLLATVSSVFYLKKTCGLCLPGIKKKWRYLLIMYSLTVMVNLSMFYLIVPVLVNASFSKSSDQIATVSKYFINEMSISVDIPCSGHASLIMDEIKKGYPAIQSIKFKLPNIFVIKYYLADVTPEEIVSLDIFKTYPATIN